MISRYSGKDFPADEVVLVRNSYYYLDCAQFYERDVIQPYHSNSEFNILYTSVDARKSGRVDRVTYGIELEIEAPLDTSRTLLTFFDRDTIKLEQDNSINDGYEIITQPMTYEYFMKEFKVKVKRGLDYLIDCGVPIHGECGMHIHFLPRKALSNASLAVFYSLFYSNTSKKTRSHLLKISQRNEESLMKWARLDTPYNLTHVHIIRQFDNERRTAINFDKRTNTYEIRIFNSSLNSKEVVKNLQFVDSILRFAETFDDTYKASIVTIDDYYVYLFRTPKDVYIELKEFLIENELVNLDKLSNWIADILEGKTECV